MKKLLMYQNGNLKLFTNVNDPQECVQKVKEFFTKEKISLGDAIKRYTIRVYYASYENSDMISGKVYQLFFPTGRLALEDKSNLWTLKGDYKNKKIDLKLFDYPNKVYAIWDLLFDLIDSDLRKNFDDFKFEMSLKSKDKKLTEHQKLILFFSKRENCQKLWSYDEIRKEMQRSGLAMSGRGIEGERPREFRYALGYPFMTSEQDKDIPDGYCRCDFPFPTLERNERRSANVSLEKADWSELLGILRGDSKRLRCFECGLFEGETNKIGQKTKFEKGHIHSHLAGGDSSKENITAICKYCNSMQKDIYSYDKTTWKKRYHTVPFLKNRNYTEKQFALRYLLRHMKKKDVDRIVKEIFEK